MCEEQSQSIYQAVQLHYDLRTRYHNIYVRSVVHLEHRAEISFWTLKCLILIRQNRHKSFSTEVLNGRGGGVNSFPLGSELQGFRIRSLSIFKKIALRLSSGLAG